MNQPDEIEYSTIEAFATPTRGGQVPASVFGSPGRYVQGEGIIDHGGHYLSRLGYRHALVLLSPRCLAAEGGRFLGSLEVAGISSTIARFKGECSLEEIDRHVQDCKNSAEKPDVLVAIGGGKAVDAGRAVAHRLGMDCAVVPSLASNDAPCAAVSVIYTEQGVTLDAEIYPRNPALVLMDTGIVASAGERYLAAGMGDAMATWYEARVSQRNPEGVTVFGGRPTLVGSAIAELCMKTLFEYGEDALESVREGRVSSALERIVEANTLMSGLGYESGGLAAAHAFAQGFTVLEKVHRTRLHGEMVAMGTLAQLMLEGEQQEAARVARFFASVGLPVHLGQLDISRTDDPSLDAVVQGAMAFPFIHNMTVPVDAALLRQALLDADALGNGLADCANGGGTV